jgi:hypothetical protein
VLRAKKNYALGEEAECAGTKKLIIHAPLACLVEKQTKERAHIIILTALSAALAQSARLRCCCCCCRDGWNLEPIKCTRANPPAIKCKLVSVAAADGAV